MSIPAITYGKMLYCEYEGNNCIVHSYKNIKKTDFENYVSLLIHDGYSIFNEYMISNHNKAVHFRKENDAVYAMFYSLMDEMRIVYEPDSEFLQYEDSPCPESCQSTLTGIDLEDYGMSYVIKLCDGRFMVLDGGWDFEPDADKLMNCLKQQSPHEIPVIACWLITHPDIDHYRCFISFMAKHGENVKIERFIYNFPDYSMNNIERVPALVHFDDISKLPQFEFWVKKSGAKVYKAHTGQKYTLSNAELEILSSPDDTFVTPITSFNDISLVIKMNICSQTILWCGDADFKKAYLAERWGAYLKSDILQIPHHGFIGGREEEYSLIDPRVCILPANEACEFRVDNIYRSQNKYLLCDLNVCDFFAGGKGQYTFDLPYSPGLHRKDMLSEKIDFYKKSSGAFYWYFDGMTKENSQFVIINTTCVEAEVYVDLYFDEPKFNIKDIKITAGGNRRKRTNLFEPSSADGDALFYNTDSLVAKGVPDGEIFTVVFKSNIPIVVKGNIPPVYYS